MNKINNDKKVNKKSFISINLNMIDCYISEINLLWNTICCFFGGFCLFLKGFIF